ncbi:tail fiber domain-containing protein [Escherichia coli]|nr:tail fiber domain-containing protein [Escherichia coli]
MIYTIGSVAASGHTLTGTGTNFKAPLSMIRVGCTVIVKSDPIQIFSITEIVSETELSITPAASPDIPAGTTYSILLCDSISVDGLAQDVAEALRYFTGQESEIYAAVEYWKNYGDAAQVEALLTAIQAETAQSTANAQKTEADKKTTEGYKNAAATSATAAKSSQDAAKASETSASNSKTAAATSATNAAKSAADALNYRNQAQGIVGDNIGLGASPRDCPDISGNPSSYIGFMRIRESATGFPSIASGEAYLTGFISGCDGSPTYTGIFQGWNTRSLYTYHWSSSIGPQWTRHARKDDISRLVQSPHESALWAAGGKQKFVLWDSGTGESIQWGVYDDEAGNFNPLGVPQGGTGGLNSGQARTNLEVMYEKKSDLSSTDINTLTGEYSGFYYQGLDANATSARGYPVSSAGALLVIRNNANGNSGCTQLYFPYNATTGTFYMRQHIIQSSSSGWEWTAWKKFQSLDFTDSPQFTNLNLVRSSDIATTAGGILQSVLNDASGAQRARARFYSEFRGDGKSWATIHLQNGDKTQYAGLSEDGDFSLNSGDFIGRRVRLTADFNYPVEISSAHPTIRFNETDRPSNTPYYSLVFDGGNWRIRKDGYDGTKTSYSMSYNYARDEIEVPNLKVNAIAVPTNLEQTKTNMQIPFAGIAHWVDYKAPTGAEAGKYYPVIVSHPSYYNGDFLVEIAMRTKSISGDEEPNCNAIHLWLRDGGWSDMGAAAFGHYFCYANNENAILCVRGTDKGQYPHNAIYVRGDAFPIRLAVTVGCTVTIPTADWKPANTADGPTYKWGITNSSDGIDLDTYGISNNLLDFTSSATGFYCTDTYRNKYGDSYQVIQSNGTIQPGNGVATYSDQDWSAQQSDNVSKFKPIAGSTNGPSDPTVFGGFHVSFSGNYATQFAGRLSQFWARSIEAGVDQGWKRLLTTDDLSASTDLTVNSLTTTTAVRSGGGDLHILGDTAYREAMNCGLTGYDSTGQNMSWYLGTYKSQEYKVYFEDYLGSEGIELNGDNGSVKLYTGGRATGTPAELTLCDNQCLSTVSYAIRPASSSWDRYLTMENHGTAYHNGTYQFWGNAVYDGRTITGDRYSVFEWKLDTGYLAFLERLADGSQKLQVNGGIHCTAVTQSSDRDLKDNIEVIPDATAAIRKMNGYTYTLKENGLPYAGIIAQEAMEAIPEAVGSFMWEGEELEGPTQDGRELRETARYLNVDYAAVTGLLVQVARETDDRVTALEEENASLRANIAVMDERITKLEALVQQLTGSEE